MLKDYLSQKNITYIEKLVDQDDMAKEEMMGKSNGFLGVPFTVVVKNDGIEENIIGFDKGKVSEIIG